VGNYVISLSVVQTSSVMTTNLSPSTYNTKKNKKWRGKRSEILMRYQKIIWGLCVEMGYSVWQRARREC
jgi:hypothetical protein